MSEDSKIAKSTWITFGVAGLGFLIFIIVFIRLQGDHEGDVAKCVEKCKTMPECRYISGGNDGNPCEELCGLAPTKAQTCMETHGTCEAFSSCVVDNP